MKFTDIIIPIYNAYDDLVCCLESIYRFTDLKQNRLIIINDNSTDNKILPLLESQKNRDNVIVIHNEINKGFSNNINIGMNKSDQNDVLLLNSDTIVTSGWIDKLKNCAYSSPEIGTVTPLSNNATICSVPEYCKENKLPENISINQMADIVERCSFKSYPRITVAHGFCMYIKREVIDTIGGFDADTFGRGYGEENDFCCRAEQAGFIHVMCDDTYIFHSGTKSFMSEEKKEYIKNHDKILKNRYPIQMHNNAVYCRDNPNHAISDNVNMYLKLSNGRKNILYLVQADFRKEAEDSIGGTQFHVRDLTYGLRVAYNIFVAARDREALVLTAYIGMEEMSWRFELGEKESFPRIIDRKLVSIFRNILIAMKIDIVHVHHTITTSFDIFYEAFKLNIPVLFTAHDFYTLCPNIKMLNSEGMVCIDKENQGMCRNCLKNNCGILDTGYFLGLWRQRCGFILQNCENVITPSTDAKKILLKYYPEIEERICVVEHGIDRQREQVCEEKLIPSDSLSYYFEGIKFEGLCPQIYGWAMDRESDCRKNKIIIEATKKSGEKCYIPTENNLRPDVSLRSDKMNCGFIAHIPLAFSSEEELGFRVIIKKGYDYLCSSELPVRFHIKNKNSREFNVAFIGGLNEAKGSRQVKDVIVNGPKDVNWFIFGGIGDCGLRDLEQYNLTKTGYYAPEDLAGLLEIHRIDLICILSMWPETYSYTLSEAVINRVPVIVTDIGALGDRTKEMQCGWTVFLDDVVNGVIKIIDRIKTKGGEYQEILEHINKVSLRTNADMCQEYELLYNKVLKPERVSLVDSYDTKLIFSAYCHEPKNTGENEESADSFQNFKEELERELAQTRTEMNAVLNSNSYKVGWVATHFHKILLSKAKLLFRKK